MTDGFASPLLTRPGAVAAAGRDSGVAAHYGDPMREQRILATAVGLVDRSNRGVVAVPGADRLTWLHDLTTQHLLTLASPQGTELLLLSPHGHVEHHALVADDGETTWLEVEPGTAGELTAFLDKMRFLSRVEPRDATGEYAVASLVGPQTGAALATLGVTEPPRPDVVAPPGPKFAAGSVPPRPTTRYGVAPLPDGGLVVRVGGPGADGADLLVPRATYAAVVQRLTDSGVAVCGLGAYEALRVADGRPRAGAETDHRTIVHDVDWLAAAVHLDKGCYRGQETVARVHNLGRPPRRLVLLHLDRADEELPAPGTPVLREGRAVGFCGTAVRHFELGPIALAVVKRNTPDDAQLTVGTMAAAID